MSAPSHPNDPTAEGPKPNAPSLAYGTPTADQLDRALLDMLANTRKAPSRGDASSPDEASLAYALALLKAAEDNALPDALFQPDNPTAVSVRVNVSQALAARREGDTGESSNKGRDSASRVARGANESSVSGDGSTSKTA
ncbi:hypothetical protein FRB95_005520 [Tulasnella sp. JGI-2019a]|nr:hypothetical protein FRB95_005520 [Tulasnella sp. JGI-2019a]